MSLRNQLRTSSPMLGSDRRIKPMRLFNLIIIGLVSLTSLSQAVAEEGNRAERVEKTNKVSNVDIKTENGKTTLRIKGSNTPSFSVFKIGNPLRLFVDISNSQLTNENFQKQVEDGLITQVGLLQFENNAQAVTRAIIGFNQNSVAQYDVKTDGNDVVIVVTGDAKPALAQKSTAPSAQTAELSAKLAAEQDARKRERDELLSLKALSKRQEARLKNLEQELNANRAAHTQEVVSAKAVAPQNTIRGLEIVSLNGRSQIIIDLDRPGAFTTTKSAEGRSVMILNDVNIPSDLKKRLANDTQGGTVRFVEATSAGKQTRLEANLTEDAEELVRQSGKRLIWEFAPKYFKQLQAKRAEESQAPKRQVAARQTPPTQDFKTAAPPRRSRVVTNPTEVTSIPGLKRKRMTLDFREVDIQNVLRLIAQEGGINIVTSEGVSGNITIKLAGVPLDEAFLTILQAQGLGYEKRGNVFRVAPQAKLVEEQKARAEAEKAAQEVRPLELFLLPVRYASAADMTDQISSLITARGSVTVDQRTNTLVIKDVADNLNAIKQLVDSLDAQVPQVLIEARIVETSDTFAREFGIQWGGDASFSQANGNPTGLSFPSVLGVTGGASSGAAPPGVSSNPNFAVNLPAAAGLGSGGALGFTLGSIGGAVNLNLRLSALEETGHAKIVSSPHIVAMDNQEASISQGTSIPISVVSSAGVQTTFVDATLELKVTPSVTPDGNIRLKINATKNEPDFQNTGASGDPSIISRAANTELMIRDGDTTVIGGIYSSNTGSSSSGVPFLKDIPILGYFFRTTASSNRRSELLIFITPRIVNRSESIGALEQSANKNDQAL